MHPADIQAALKKKGLTQKDLADKIDVCPMTVSQVVSQKGSGSERIRQAIAAEIGIPAHIVFDRYYTRQHLRRKRMAA